MENRFLAPRLRMRADGTLILIGGDNEHHRDLGAFGSTYMYFSPNQGLAWSAPSLIARGESDLSVVALAPDGNAVFTLREETDRLDMQYAGFGGVETRSLNVMYGNEFAFWNDLEVLPDGRVMVVFGDRETLRWRLFGGGDPYDINNWAAQGSVPNVFDGFLVSGPRGTYFFEHRTLRDQRIGNTAPFWLRRLDTRRLRFRRPIEAAADRSIFGNSTASQDARGRLHVIAETGGAGRTRCVLYTRTGPVGSRRQPWFGKTTVLHRTTDPDREPVAVRVGAGADGRGWALWQDEQADWWALPLRQARGKYRRRANQNDRPACVGRRYS